MVGQMSHVLCSESVSCRLNHQWSQQRSQQRSQLRSQQQRGSTALLYHHLTEMLTGGVWRYWTSHPPAGCAAVSKQAWVFMIPSDQEIQYSRYLVNKKYQENLGHMKSEWIWHDMIMIRVLIHSEGRAWHIAMTLFDVASIQFEPDVVTYGAREHGKTYCGRAVHFLQSTWCTCNCWIWRSWLALDRKLKKH